MNGTTLLEQLTAEMVVDVAKVHQQVEEIKRSFPLVFEQAALHATNQLQENLIEVIRQIESGIQRERQFAQVILSFETDAKKRIEHQVIHSFDQEIKRTRRVLEAIANEVLVELRWEAERASPTKWRIKYFSTMVVALALAFAAGLVVATKGSARTLLFTPEELRQISYGQQLEDIAPGLQKPTIDCLVKNKRR